MNVSAALRVARSLGLAVAISLGLALVFAAFVGVAHADVPDVRYCTHDALVVAAPGGGFPFTITVRDASSQPLPGGTVVLDFNPATGVVLCEAQDEDHDRRLVALSGATGAVVFEPEAGGVSNGTVRIEVGGQFLADVPVRTLDLDGDRDVDADDRAALAVLVGTASAAGDLDGNGTVDAADQAILEQHVGAVCGSAPEVRVATWGLLKDLYR